MHRVQPLPQQRCLRVALYSHDSQGLGHLRRNLAIATALSTMDPRPEILLLAGAREARSFPLPPNTDCVTLPSVRKDVDGHYAPDRLSMSLGALLQLRGRTLDAAIEVFMPDVLVVDKAPRGLGGELDTILERLADRPDVRVVLGLRDVLDDPAAVRREWDADATLSWIDRCYDAVWVYGDQRIHDPVVAHDLPPSVAAKLRHVGYVTTAEPAALTTEPPGGPPEQAAVDPGPQGSTAPVGRDHPRGAWFDLCVLGGGQDGHGVAQAFLEADRPRGVGAVVVTGPYMLDEQRADLCRNRDDDTEVWEFVPDLARLLARARRVVCMGGYNTSLEVLRSGTPALVVPRVRPRTEQLIRARRLAALGLVDLCHPDDCSPAVLSDWLHRDAGPERPAEMVVDLDGARRLPGLLRDLVASHPSAARRIAHAS